MQVFDETVQGMPVIFVEARHAPQAARTFGVAGGFRDGDRLPVFTDPVVTVATALDEQPQEVLGLALIRRRSRRSRALDITGGPVHSQRRHGRSLRYVDRSRADRAAAGIAPTSVASAAQPVPSDRACTALVGQTGEVHLRLFQLGSWAFGCVTVTPESRPAPYAREMKLRGIFVRAA
jgi:hypothetical protein